MSIATRLLLDYSFSDSRLFFCSNRVLETITVGQTTSGHHVVCERPEVDRSQFTIEVGEEVIRILSLVVNEYLTSSFCLHPKDVSNKSNQ